MLGVAAVVISIATTGVGVFAGMGDPPLAAREPTTPLAIQTSHIERGPLGVSRSARRREAAIAGGASAAERFATPSRASDAVEKPARPMPNAKSTTAQEVTLAPATPSPRWTTVQLNLWRSADDSDQRPEGEVSAGTKLTATGRARTGRVEVLVDGARRWVTAGYLSEHPPPEPKATCDNGTSVPSNVSPNIIAVHRAVCAAFPTISAYGTLRGGGGDHPLGRAVDIMVAGGPGWSVAELVRDNAAELGVTYIIYSQRIWSTERAAEGWRAMADRGSVTANHYDHVHVSAR